MRKKVVYPCIWVISSVILFLLLYYPNYVGVGDNSDFGRVMQPLGLKINVEDKYLYAQKIFDYTTQWESLGDYLSYVTCPPIKNIGNYHSTQFLMLKLAGYVNGIYQYVTKGIIKQFHMGALSILYILLLSLSTTLFIKSIKTRYWLTKVLISLIFIWIFYDKGYILYLNSFYGEPLILVSFLLFVGSILVILSAPRTSILWYIISFMAGGLFVGAKVANIPMGILMILFYGLLFFWNKDKVIRGIILVGSIGICVISLYYITRVPQWMNDFNRYHAIFYGVLKDSEDPAGDLRSLGIDEQYAILANTHAYMDHEGIDIHSEGFRQEVYARGTPMKISLYYLTHPEKLWSKVIKLVRSSTIIRPTYVGNYLKGDKPPLTFDRRYSTWEAVRKKAGPQSLQWIMLIGITYMISSLISYRWQMGTHPKGRLCFRVLIGLFAVSQFILPIIGNGEADLVKHMYLFNMALDMMIIFILLDIVLWLEARRYKETLMLILPWTSVVIVAVVMGLGYQPQVMTMGTYRGKPLKWVIVQETDGKQVLIAKEIIGNIPYDATSNQWSTSDLRQWLNSEKVGGFLHGFTDDEKKRLVEQEYKTVVAPDLSSQATVGHEALFWYPILGDITQNYARAYGQMVRDRVFLLSVEEYEKYTFNKIKSGKYWLRTPYSISGTVRYVDKDGLVYHKMVWEDSIGVLPCIVINK